MGRWTQYDEDEYRLPEGMKRIGYDADSGRYIFQDRDGSIWQGAQGAEFSEMTKISDGPAPSGQDDDDDVEMSPLRADGYQPLSTDTDLPMAFSKPVNGSAYRTLFPFFLAVGVVLLIVWRFIVYPSINWSAACHCPNGTESYMVQAGDSCWDISNAHGFSLDELKKLNPKVVCEPLLPGQMLCLPSSTPSTSSP